MVYGIYLAVCGEEVTIRSLSGISLAFPYGEEAEESLKSPD